MGLQPSFSMSTQLFNLILADPIMLLRVEHRYQDVQVCEHILKRGYLPQFHGVIVALAPFWKRLVERVMLRAHHVSERFEQTLQNVRSTPARQRSNPRNQRQRLVHHLWPSLARPRERTSENAGYRDAEKRRRPRGPVIHRLIQSAAGPARSPSRTHEPDRINVQQQRGRAALCRRFRIEDMR